MQHPYLQTLTARKILSKALREVGIMFPTCRSVQGYLVCEIRNFNKWEFNYICFRSSHYNLRFRNENKIKPENINHTTDGYQAANQLCPILFILMILNGRELHNQIIIQSHQVRLELHLNIFTIFSVIFLFLTRVYFD